MTMTDLFQEMNVSELFPSLSKQVASKFSRVTPVETESIAGALIALAIATLWFGSLGILFYVNIAQLSAIWVILAIAGRTFLQTGLFIIAHDAMHGIIFPKNQRVNHAIGSIAINLYAFLPYKACFQRHWQHHHNPGQAGDPDFHDGIHTNALSWYVKFMSVYLDTKQKIVLFIFMSIVFCTLENILHIPVANLLLFWVVPILLSSIQLFFFGTYLPHREQPARHSSSHNAVSSNYPIALSFLTCYHFGYHQEHHEFPFLPWYKLPSARKHFPQTANSQL
jgi:beta-carotene/zeaxanthin 4-ketolase